MEGEKFCLRWNEFESNLGIALRDLRDNNDFFDLTLACDDAQEIQVHKVILSACSSFFRNILRRLPHHHPLVYLRGIKLTDLQSIVNFIYHGEVNVAQEDLNTFLMLAEDLKIKGLTQCHGSQLGDNNSKWSKVTSKPLTVSATPSLCPPLRPAPVSRSSPKTNNRLSTSIVVPSANVPPPNVITNSIDNIAIKTEIDREDSDDITDSNRPSNSYRSSPDNFRDNDQENSCNDHNDFPLGIPPLTIGVTEGNKVEVLIKEESIENLNPDDELELMGDVYKCRLCYKSLDCLDTAKNHILAHFALPGGLTCLQCGLSFNSKVLFGVHMSSEHRNIKKW